MLIFILYEIFSQQKWYLWHIHNQNHRSDESIYTERHTLRMAVIATSLLMHPSDRALMARLTNHMQGTQNLLWGEGSSSNCLSSSAVIRPTVQESVQPISILPKWRMLTLHEIIQWSGADKLQKSSSKSWILILCDPWICTILPKVLAPLLMNRLDYSSNFHEYKS